MSNPWLSIPLAEYEGHMGAVKQLGALSELFTRALEVCVPDSVAVLGIAGGNGLECLDQTGRMRSTLYLAGTRAFNSSSQFCTRIISAARTGGRSFCWTIKKRRPSDVTS